MDRGTKLSLCDHVPKIMIDMIGEHAQFFRTLKIEPFVTDVFARCGAIKDGKKVKSMTERGFEPLPSFEDEKPDFQVSFRLSHTL